MVWLSWGGVIEEQLKLMGADILPSPLILKKIALTGKPLQSI
jgi:hypothetical protein